jgi:hypothetical protein
MHTVVGEGREPEDGPRSWLRDQVLWRRAGILARWCQALSVAMEFMGEEASR